MKRQLVVGIDGSQESATALIWAVAEAARRDLDLQLVYAVAIPMSSTAFGPVYEVPLLADFERYAVEVLMAAQRVALDLDPSVAVTTRYATGVAADVLAEASRGAAGLVVGSRGLGSIGGALLGSVSIGLAGKAHAPMYVIPPLDEGRSAGADGPVVVGVDGSPDGDVALRFALDEAACRPTSVRVVTAYHLPWLAFPTEAAVISSFDDAERQSATAAAEHSLARVRTGADTAPIEIVIVDSPPAEAIISQSEDAVLTVVGSRGHGTLRRILLGSVSRAVIHEAQGPVAVVRTGEEAESHPRWMRPHHAG